MPDRLPLDHGLTVGRQAMPGQVVLDHPNVSRRHAAFEVADGNIVLRDLGGANGTFVNGARLRGARSLVPGDRIDIGPFQLTFDGTALTRAWRVGNVELLVRGVSYNVPGRQVGGLPRLILHDANLRRSAEGGYLIGKTIADTAPLLEGLINVTGDSMSVHNPRNYLPLADGQLADPAVEKLLRQLADLLVHGAPQRGDEGRATQKSDTDA